MAGSNTFDAGGSSDAAGKTFRTCRLEALAGAGFPISDLPYSLKTSLENLLRPENGSLIEPE